MSGAVSRTGILACHIKRRTGMCAPLRQTRMSALLKETGLVVLSAMKWVPMRARHFEENHWGKWSRGRAAGCSAFYPAGLCAR